MENSHGPMGKNTSACIKTIKKTVSEFSIGQNTVKPMWAFGKTESKMDTELL